MCPTPHFLLPIASDHQLLPRSFLAVSSVSPKISLPLPLSFTAHRPWLCYPHSQPIAQSQQGVDLPRCPRVRGVADSVFACSR